MSEVEQAEQAERRRRIRAARMLAMPTADEIAARIARDEDGDREHQGLTQPELAARLKASGERLGFELLSKLERGDRDVGPHHMRRIAEACCLPHSFFTLDFWAVDEFIRRDVGVPQPEGSLRQRLLSGQPNPEARGDTDAERGQWSGRGGGA